METYRGLDITVDESSTGYEVEGQYLVRPPEGGMVFNASSKAGEVYSTVSLPDVVRLAKEQIDRHLDK